MRDIVKVRKTAYVLRRIITFGALLYRLHFLSCKHMQVWIRKCALIKSVYVSINEYDLPFQGGHGAGGGRFFLFGVIFYMRNLMGTELFIITFPEVVKMWEIALQIFIVFSVIMDRL